MSWLFFFFQSATSPILGIVNGLTGLIIFSAAEESPNFMKKYQKAFPSYSINGHIEAADILMENIEEATDQAQTAYHGMIILLTSKDHS